MTVIAIQSQVVHGHVGNSAAVFPLQACGIEVAAVRAAPAWTGTAVGSGSLRPR